MKWVILSIILICLIITFIIYICNSIIVTNSKGKVFNSVSEIPYRKVGLLLGTSKFTSFGPVNPYYKYRIDAAAELYKNRKVNYIIVSGDNGKNNYNEPEQMKVDLIQEGVAPSVIYCDYAGFRTFDSMIRLKKIFHQNEVTVISQQFHNERAIYIGKRIGIDAIGYNAKDLSGKAGFDTQFREKLARVKVFVDFVLGTRPKFLGNPIHLPS